MSGSNLINSRGSCHSLADGQFALGLAYGEKLITIVTNSGNAHEAAWLAHIGAAALARTMGLTEVRLRTTNRHVVNQLNNTWKVRSPMMRRYRDAFVELFGDMKIVHSY